MDLFNISTMGMVSQRIGELEDLCWADVKTAVRVDRNNTDKILGVRDRLSRDVTGQQYVDSLE